MADFPTFVNLFFGALIIGGGYLGLMLKYCIEHRDFYGLKSFDKSIQSIILGIVSFIISITILHIPVDTIESDQQMLNYMVNRIDFIILHLGLILALVFIIEAFLALYRFSSTNIKNVNNSTAVFGEIWELEAKILSNLFNPTFDIIKDVVESISTFFRKPKP